jgi:hypothetical protein
MSSAEVFASSAVALYAAHHVGDYWVQTDHQARHKGDAGWPGRLQCAMHCVSYLITQAVFLAVLTIVTGLDTSSGALSIALAVSGVTHYLADRREHGLMLWLAHRLPGKADFLRLGVPRPSQHEELWEPCPSCEGRGTSDDESAGGKCWDCKAGGMLPGTLIISDNPSLGTGSWALDQAWHIFFGVFVAALVLAA